ncbi:MAG: imidazole glycerol phosphate synthase subunit HisF [Candidatus Omnitrophica bacterium]|jgi:cyclase|nr:imidazole glycerol phosphate synthase subunit HisF [Candidatus Omnitrophota bacterium]
MLAKRIIPCLDINKGRVVKGVNFINLRDAGDPVKNAEFYEREGADELVFLDITASIEKRSTTIDLVRKVAKVVFMPFTVGGGINSIKEIRELLLAGAEKVSLNTAAVKNPKLISKASEIFGSQCIVVAIDAKRKTQNARRKTNKWEVYINGGRTPTGIDVVSWAKKIEKMGAGEILLTSMDCDGTKDGFDIALTKAVTEVVKIPVIASGGAGQLSHFYDIFKKTKATAALAASVFHFRELSVSKIKEYLDKKGIMVRI